MKLESVLTSSRKTIIGASFAVGYFFGSFSTVPLIIGALVTFLSLTETNAGLLMTGEQFGFGLSLMFFAPFVGRFSRRKTITLMLVLAVPLNVAAMFVEHIQILSALRIVTGILAGIGVAQIYSIASDMRDPVRFLGFMAIASTLAGFVLLLFTGYLIEPMGIAGVFLPLGIAALLGVLFSFQITSSTPTVNTQSDQKLKVGLLPIALLSFGILIVAITEAACFAFIERLGIDLGASVEDMALIISISFLTGLLGSGLATILGNRFGMLWPCLLGAGFLSLSIALVGLSQNTLMLILSLNALQFALFFYLPYVFAMGAPWDNLGRVVAFTPSLNFIGLGLGPALGGALLESWGFSFMVYLAIGAVFLACPCFIMAARMTTNFTNSPG